MTVSFEYGELIDFITKQQEKHNAEYQRLIGLVEPVNNPAETMQLRYQSMIELGKASAWGEVWHELSKRV